MIIRLGAFVVFALLGTAAIAQDAQKPPKNEVRDMMRELGAGLTDKELAAAIAAAEQNPLGSKQNPVRENGPGGERAYLAKLRCTDGQAPAFRREGNIGRGPYGYIVDLYQVTCPGQSTVPVHIDMYHDGGETRPVPGFAIVD